MTDITALPNKAVVDAATKFLTSSAELVSYTQLKTELISDVISDTIPLSPSLTQSLSQYGTIQLIGTSIANAGIIQATEAAAGIAAIASQAVANAATDDTKFITSLKAGILQKPTFKAFLSANIALSASTETRINFNTESWDTNSWYDNVTNFRFIPLRAGYYLLLSTITNTSDSDPSIGIETRIRKNGTISDRSTVTGRANTSPQSSANCSAIIAMNGSTDFIDVAAFSNGSGVIQGGASLTSFSAIFLGGL